MSPFHQTPFDIIVDHRQPAHDTLCRCRVCKPPLVRERSMLRVWLSLGILAMAVGIAIEVWA